MLFFLPRYSSWNFLLFYVLHLYLWRPISSLPVLFGYVPTHNIIVNFCLPKIMHIVPLVNSTFVSIQKACKILIQNKQIQLYSFSISFNFMSVIDFTTPNAVMLPQPLLTITFYLLLFYSCFEWLCQWHILLTAG